MTSLIVIIVNTIKEVFNEDVKLNIGSFIRKYI